MSAAARAALCGRLIFQDEHDGTEEPTQRADLLDEALTQTGLIALLQGLEAAVPGVTLEITAVRRDHRDDSADGLHCHANGYCADFWPATAPGAYVDAQDPRFARLLAAGAASPWLWQLGLAGSAWTPQNEAAAGATAFHDTGDDHVHAGAHN